MVVGFSPSGLSALVKKGSGGVVVRFLGAEFLGEKTCRKKTVLGEAMVVYNSNKKIHSFIKLGTNFTIFYVKLLLCFS